MPTENTLEIVLQEIRATRAELSTQQANAQAQTSSEILELRQDMAAWQQKYGERLAEVEKSVRTGIDGNGTPSRLRVLELAVAGLQRVRYGLMGAASAIGALVGSVATIGGQILVAFLHH